MKKSEIKKALMELDKLPMPELFGTAAKKQRIRSPFLRRNIIIAAAVFVFLTALVGCAAEVKEYNDAVDFFEEHELNRENLSRTEIKKVYRDIITETFALEETAVVIIDSYEGKAIGISKPSSEEIKDIWNKIDRGMNDIYSWKYLDNDIEIDGIPHSGEMIFRKEENSVLLWETKIPLRDGYIEDYILLSNGKYVAAYGIYSPLTAGYKTFGFVEIFDGASGESVLRKIFDQYKRFSISEIIETEAGMALFCRADLENFIFIEMDISGEILKQRITEIGNRGIWDVAPFGDGYIVQLGGYQVNETLVRVSSNGELGEGISYSADDCAYFICDMLEYGGRLYLSAYAVPKHGKDIETSHDEISYVLEKIWKMYDDAEVVAEETSTDGGIIRNGMYMSTETLVDDLRENYTAVLLVCDAESGIPDEFYSVEGSLCGELSLSENGEMLWETQYISEAYYSPATSSFSIAGASVVYRHRFDSEGKLIKTEKTGEIADFRR